MTTERIRPADTTTPAQTPEAMIFRLLARLDAIPDDASALRLALETITAIVPCEQAFLYAWGEQAGQPQLRCSASIERTFFNDYLARFRAIDPFASQMVQRRCIQEARSLAADEVLPPAALRRTPFHLRFLARHGELVHGLCHYAWLDERQRIGLRLFRRADQAPFSLDERELLDLFHTQIVIQLRHRHALAQARRERDALRAGMDLMNQPVFLLDARARVVACNRAASALAREGRHVRLADDRLLPGRLLDHASWIPAAIERLRHPEDKAAAPKSRLQVLPCRRREISPYYGILSLLDERKASGTAVALLSLIDMQQPAPRHSLDELRRAFGFTAAEARIADAMMMDMGTEEISNTYLIRRDTVRSHVKHLLTKTGTHGHAELQKLLLRISPNLTTLQHKGPTPG